MFPLARPTWTRILSGSGKIGWLVSHYDKLCRVAVSAWFCWYWAYGWWLKRRLFYLLFEDI
jgi:hypothetical protein